MNWFFRWFQTRLNRMNYEECHGTQPTPIRGGGFRDTIGSNNALNFTVHAANGGYVLEYNSYDDQRDRTERRLYVIHEGEDLGESLSKTITLELLRK